MPRRSKIAFLVLLAVAVTVSAACSTGSRRKRRRPTPPDGVQAQAGDSQVTVSWDPVLRATSYNIYWDTSPGVTPLTGNVIPDLTASPYVHTGLANGTDYYYIVTAANPKKESDTSSEAVARPIGPPTGVVANPGSCQASICWNPSPGAESYTIYWGTGPGVTRATGTPIPGVTSCHDVLGLANGGTYCFVVTASNTVGLGVESGESAEACADLQTAGVPDLTFGGLGWITHDDAAGAGGNGNDRGTAVRIDGSGRVVVTGYSQGPGGDTDLAVWRLLGDGTLDTSFGGQGFVTVDDTAGGAGDDEGNALVVDGGGRLLVAGRSESNLSAFKDAVVWAFDSTGAPDPGFGTGGATLLGQAFDNWCDDLALDSSDNILVTGSSTLVGGNDMTVWRLLPDGTLDASFNGTGFFAHNDAAGGNNFDRGHAVAVDGAGRILVAGESWNGADFDMVIWRLLPTGALDTSFDSDGWVTYATGPAALVAFDAGLAVAVDGADRILVAGASGGTLGLDMSLWRYLPTGAPDPAFNGAGMARHDNAAGGSGDDVGSDVALDAGGRILVSGFSTAVGDIDMVVWRYLDDGTLDPSFGSGGTLLEDMPGAGLGEDGLGLTTDACGNVLVAGYTLVGPDTDMVIWRYR